MPKDTRPSTAGSRPASPRRRLAARVLAVALIALTVAACDQSAATPPTPASTPTAPVTPFVPTPSPTPQLVKNVTLVAQVVPPEAASLSGLAWKGVQEAAAAAGAKATLVQPVTVAELATAVESAAAGERAVIVTIGAAGAAAVAAAAAAHPGTQFLELDVVPAADAPANVHGILFDEAEAGYLAGFVAASFTSSGTVGFAGTTAADTANSNYSAGFAAGAVLARADVAAPVVLAGTASSPDNGRTASSTLIKAGADVVAAQTGVVGIASLREACRLKARLVAIETDAWQTVADIGPCLIASVLLRYDTAVSGAIAVLAAGGTLGAATTESVATGAITVSELHVDAPAGFAGKLASVLAALRDNPPRSTPAPPSASASAAP